MIEIDGSQGEGGGQILRTSLACSALTGRSVRISNIRAGRPKPGLQRQHLAGVESLARVCSATLSGAVLQSTVLTFEPPSSLKCAATDWTFDIGSAGSTTLVLQTLLPVVLRLTLPSDEDSRVHKITVIGGTHNPFAPPATFLTEALAPQLAAAGANVHFSLEHHGFFPAGGGCVTMTVEPLASPKPFALLEKGPLVSRTAEALLANLPADIGRREAGEFARVSGWPSGSCTHRRVDASGPGNVVLATLVYGAVTEVVTAHGEKRKPAEAVARQAADAARAYEACAAPVSEHLSDQLLLPLVVAAGGTFVMGRPSSHFVTNVGVLRAFFGEDVVTYREISTADPAGGATSAASDAAAAPSSSGPAAHSAGAGLWEVTVRPATDAQMPAVSGIRANEAGVIMQQ